MKRKTLTNWVGLPPDFSPDDWAGFVYLIVNVLTQQKYIGKKFLKSIRRTKVKGKRKRKVVRKESDWREYKSSSEELQKDILTYGEGSFEFRILHLCKTRAETNYLEVKEQFIRDVLNSRLPDGRYEYYNECILARYYRKRY